MKSPIHYSWKTEAIPIILIVISFFLSIYFYLNFPDQIATHWDFEGKVNGYSHKFLGSFLFPLLITFMYAIFVVLPFCDPKKENYKKFEKKYHQFKTVFTGMLFFLFIIMGLFNLGYPISVGKIVPMTVGILILFIGNSMKSLKRNWFFGIRTPWTMSSDVVWDRTHRFGGYLFILFGLVLFAVPFLGSFPGFITFTLGILVTVFGTILYSYIVYKKTH